MEKMTSEERAARAEEIACMADRGEDISRFFESDGRMMPPLQGPLIIGVSPIWDEASDRKKR
jgi:hypothetical protein